MCERWRLCIAIVSATSDCEISAELEVLGQQAAEPVSAAAHVRSHSVIVGVATGEERALLVAKTIEELLISQTRTLEVGAALSFLVSCDIEARAEAQMNPRVLKTTRLGLTAGEGACPDWKVSTCKIDALLVASPKNLLFVAGTLVAII